jgi:16S rRNA (uracil1498-N3)-methyltransferase
MNHLFRFFGNRENNNRWAIVGDEFLHLKKVLRLKEGDLVEVTDGQGYFAEGKIAEITSNFAYVEIGETLSEQKTDNTLIVMIGALKHKETDELIAPLVELGAQKILVFCQEQTEKSRISESALERWQRIAASAVKQSKSNWLPEITLYKNINDMISSLESEIKNRYVLEDDCSADLLSAPLTKNPAGVVIGSEKGFSEKELELLEAAGFKKVNISKNTLRSKTAAIAGAGILALRLKKL